VTARCRLPLVVALSPTPDLARVNGLPGYKPFAGKPRLFVA
jgi:hypothetical protein